MLEVIFLKHRFHCTQPFFSQCLLDAVCLPAPFLNVYGSDNKVKIKLIVRKGEISNKNDHK